MLHFKGATKNGEAFILIILIILVNGESYLSPQSHILHDYWLRFFVLPHHVCFPQSLVLLDIHDKVGRASSCLQALILLSNSLIRSRYDVGVLAILGRCQIVLPVLATSRCPSMMIPLITISLIISFNLRNKKCFRC